MHYLRVAFLVFAACGGGGSSHLTDAGSPDGASDSSAPPAPVTLTVTQNGQPTKGVHTYFVNPDNTVAATIDTDATGTASAMVADGGSVTAIDPFKPTQPDPTRTIELRTYLAVKAGDHLTMTSNDPPTITVTIKAPLLSGRNHYDVLTTCGTGSLSSIDATGTVGLSGCNGIADIMITTSPIGAGTDRFALYHPSVSVADGAMVDLTAETFQPQRDVTFHYTHVPSGAGVSVLHAFVTANGVMGRGGVVFDGSTGNVQNGEATITYKVPDIAGASALLDHVVEIRGNHDVTEHRPLAASFDLDLSGMMLPEWAEGPHYDAAHQAIAWTDAAGGATPNMQFGIAHITPPLKVPPISIKAAAPTQAWIWQLAGPYAAGELKLPALPTDVATWVPTADDTVDAGLVVLKVPGGYDAIRTRIFDEIGLTDFERTLAVGEPFLKTEN